jgi:hypothetical protein
MAWFCLWMIAIWNSEQGVGEASDRLAPAGFQGNFWGPEATRARLAGELPPLPTSPVMITWDRWGRTVLREGDIVFRLGDAQIVRGCFPLSRFIAGASGSLFSHTGIVAIEEGVPMVYDCSSIGVRCQPFEFWMLDCVGALGVKRLKPEYRRHIPGVIEDCRKEFEQQVPFDFLFRLDDAALYCLEMTEKAFRSQGLALSQPVRIGDWEHLTAYPLTTFAFLQGSELMVGQPITLEQPVYLPGNERHGVWSSPLLETVFGPELKRGHDAAPGAADHLSLRGDLELTVITAEALRRSYEELPLRWLSDQVRISHLQRLFLDDRPTRADGIVAN